jgi:hypothetical protein
VNEFEQITSGQNASADKNHRGAFGLASALAAAAAMAVLAALALEAPVADLGGIQ